MKHSVTLQSRNTRWLAFFYAVCNVIRMCITLSLGGNTSLNIAQAKAILLRQGKNPNVPSDFIRQLPIHFVPQVSASQVSEDFVICHYGGL